jgi:hypothetical protein
LDRLDELTRHLVDDMDREDPAHPFTASDAHLGECLACLDRFVALRDAVHGMAAPEPVSRHLARALDDLQGRPTGDRLGLRVVAALRGAFGVRVPAWAAAVGAAALVAVTWMATQYVRPLPPGAQWALPDGARPDRLRPAHGQATRTVTGVVSSVEDATANGVHAHILGVKDASGTRYVFFTWGLPTVKPGDKVQIEAIFTHPARSDNPRGYQGIITELRRAN